MCRQPLDMGLRMLTPPGRGGEGGAWRRAPQAGSLGMTEKWRWKARRTRVPGSGLHTDGRMLHCVEPRRTTRTGSRETTGKSSQAPVAQHRWVRTRRACENSDRRTWPGRSGDHIRSRKKSCVMPFERKKAAGQSRQTSMQLLWHTQWGWSANSFQKDCGGRSRRDNDWKRSPHKSGAVLRHCRSWHTRRIQSWSGVWWDSRYFQRCWASQSARRPASASTGWGFWQERRNSMTAKSTGLGLPVLFQEWPSNGCSSAPGLRKDAGTSTSSSGWSLRTKCKTSWKTYCLDPSGRISDGMHGDAWDQRPCTRLGESSQASKHGSGGGAQGRQWPTSIAHTQGASDTCSRHLPPRVTSRGNHGLRERQPGDARHSGHLRPTISLRGTPRRATLGIPHALGHPRTAPHLGRPTAGGVRGDT